MYDLCTYLWKGEKKCFRGNNSKGGCCANQDCLLLDFSQQGWEHLLSSLPPERIISSQSANSIHCRLRYQPDTGEKFWLLYCTSSIKTQQTNIVRARSIHRLLSAIVVGFWCVAARRNRLGNRILLWPLSEFDNVRPCDRRGPVKCDRVNKTHTYTVSCTCTPTFVYVYIETLSCCWLSPSFSRSVGRSHTAAAFAHEAKF